MRGEREGDGAVVVATGVVVEAHDAGARLAEPDVRQLVEEVLIVGEAERRRRAGR